MDSHLSLSTPSITQASVSSFSPLQETEKKPKERKIIQIFQEVADEHQIKMQALSHGWLVRFEKESVHKHAFGYELELNCCTTSSLCTDKAAASTLFKINGIPHVEHELFFTPGMGNFVPETGVWEQIQSFAKGHNYQVVCKTKDGSNGSDVFKVKSPRELEKAVQYLFNRNRDLCLCPFYEIENEFRVIMLNQTPELIFKKIRPYLVGDGQSTLKDLFFKNVSQKNAVDAAVFIRDFDPSIFSDERILAKDETVTLKWKHNLCQGASAEVYTESGEQKEKIISVAVKAAHALNVAFASVDVISLKNGEHRIMEINSGVMMENFIHQYGEEGYQKAKSIYTKAIRQMMGL